jgi:type VI secretion system protein ImpF
VRAVAHESAGNTITFEIEGDMWAQPYPERLYLKTELDVDRAQIRIVDNATPKGAP